METGLLEDLSNHSIFGQSSTWKQAILITVLLNVRLMAEIISDHESLTPISLLFPSDCRIGVVDVEPFLV